MLLINLFSLLIYLVEQIQTLDLLSHVVIHTPKKKKKKKPKQKQNKTKEESMHRFVNVKLPLPQSLPNITPTYLLFTSIILAQQNLPKNNR